MKDGEIQIGPESKEELRRGLKEMLKGLWWLFAPMLLMLVVGFIVLFKFRGVILERLEF